MSSHRVALLQHKRFGILLRFVGLGLALFSAGTLFAQSVTIGFNGVGPNSLLVNGTQLLSYGDFRLNGLTFLTPDGRLCLAI